MSATRLALCSDTHFWPGATRRYGHDEEQLQPWSVPLQAALLAELSAAAPDLILHLGDLTCGGGHFEMPEDEFYTVLAATVQAFASLPASFQALPGNHDCPANGDWTFAEQQLGLGPGLGRTIDLPAARLVLLNAQGHSAEQLAAAYPRGPNAGWVNQAELTRLADALATAGERPVLIFSHQLLRPWSGAQPWKELYAIENAGA
ncbi:MAG: metallophosphoesterase, partial [Anaerolineae bacterium]|nr:metallophosphoesterase [Anaerolineae bacterium]